MNTLTLEYAGHGLCIFEATDRNLEKLTSRIIKLKVSEDDFLDAATRLMDAEGDLAGSDLDMTIFMAIRQIGGADLDDPHVREIPSKRLSLAWFVPTTGIFCILSLLGWTHSRS